MALFRTLPTPIYVLLPRLMVEVYLVLAPDVNFFLNSRTGVQTLFAVGKLPCWRSLGFSLLGNGISMVTLFSGGLQEKGLQSRVTASFLKKNHQCMKGKI